MVSDEDYKLYQGALSAASVASNEAYQEAFNDFKAQYEDAVKLIQDQLNANIQTIYSQNISEINVGEDMLSSAEAWAMTIAGVFNGEGGDWNKYFFEANQRKTLESAKESVSGVISAVDEMAKAAEITPIIIPVETAYTAAASGLINVKGVATGHLSLQPEEIKVISAAYSSGTNYSADTFLAGENGAEIVTNARGYQVYTAEETKDIFDTYTQIVSFLPMLQRVNTAASVKAPELSAGNETAAPVNVTVTIEQNISGSASDSLKESNEDLIYKIREVMEEISRDSRRRAFN